MKRKLDLSRARDQVLNEAEQQDRQIKGMKKGARVFKEAYLKGGQEAGTKAIEEMLKDQEQASTAESPSNSTGEPTK